MSQPTLINKHRCPRCLRDQLYIDYHDKEWGVPVHDDQKHFEFLVLETFQAGLSRYTILAKRENFRRAFDGFTPHKIANYTTAKIDELATDAGIIRNRAKIIATVTNARVFLDIQKKRGSRETFIRRYTDGQTIYNQRTDHRDCPAKTALSDRISADLKQLGMKFVGSTVIYAHLQATGQINDHVVDCWKYGG
ncbi:MAG TPA: DNA-3-methyladenine glycosylase I [Candidatus Absconditabacterales bacterium]|nr:DNA-3-methyladenine glycosylase I [Candidatus Absconditabacterales bacterium]